MTDMQNANGITRRSALAIGGGIGLTALAGCKSHTARPTGNRDVIVAGILASPANWDPDFPGSVNTYPSQLVRRNTYPYALDFGIADSKGSGIASTTSLEGMIFESFESNAAGDVWTGRIRRDAVWASGDRVTAEDFRWTKERGLYFKGNVKFVYSLIGITSADQITAVDEYTVQFHQNFPSALSPQAQVIAGWCFSKKEMLSHATADDPWAHNWRNATPPANGGVFDVTSFTPGQQLVLDRNERFPHLPAKVRQVQMPITSASAMGLQLERGNLDIACGMPRTAAYRMKDRSGVTVVARPSGDMASIIFLVNQPPFDDVSVRRAVAMAMPYKAIIQNVWQGAARPSRSFAPLDAPGCVDSYPFEEDLDQAQSLLAKAGRQSGFETELVINAGDTELQAIAILVADQLKKLNIEVKISQPDPATYAQRLVKQDIPMVLSIGGLFINDIDYLLGFRYVKGGPGNSGAYSNAEIAQIHAAASKSSDRAQRLKLFARAQAILAADAPAVMLGQPHTAVPMRSDIAGYIATPDALIRLGYLGR